MGAPVTGGRITYGKAERVSAKAQVHVPYDFIIWLANDGYQSSAGGQLGFQLFRHFRDCSAQHDDVERCVAAVAFDAVADR